MSLFMSQRMQVTTRTKLHNNTKEIGGFKFSIQSGQKRVIQHLQDLLLHFSSMHLLLLLQHLFVHNFHGIQTTRLMATVLTVLVVETAEVNGPDVPSTDTAVEVKVSEGEAGFSAESSRADCGVSEVGGAVRLQGEVFRRRFRSGEFKRKTTETATAFTAH